MSVAEVTVTIASPEECGHARIMPWLTVTEDQADALERVGHIARCTEGCAEHVYHPLSPWEQVAHAIDRIEASSC